MPTPRPAASAATASAAAASPLFTLPGLVHREGSAVKLHAIHRSDGRLGVLLGSEVDKREAPWLTRFAVGHDADLRDIAPVCSAYSSKRIFVRVEGEVANIDARTHGDHLARSTEKGIPN